MVCADKSPAVCSGSVARVGAVTSDEGTALLKAFPPRFLPPPDLPLLLFPLLLCTSYLRCQESSLTEFIVAILIKLIFLSARLLGSEAGMRFIDFHLEGKVSSFHSHEAI